MRKRVVRFRPILLSSELRPVGRTNEASDLGRIETGLLALAPHSSSHIAAKVHSLISALRGRSK